MTLDNSNCHHCSCLTAAPAIFLQNVCCEFIAFFVLIHRLFTIICDYFCKWVSVRGEGLKVGNLYISLLYNDVF